MTLDDHGWTQFLAAVRREIPSWEVFATEARIRASRSSSGSGEREAPNPRDAHKLLTCGCGPFSTIDCACCGAKAGEPCAILSPASGIAAMASSRSALSSAPPAPSGERVRALEEALRKVMKAKSGTEAYEVARRALSPQGDAT